MTSYGTNSATNMEMRHLSDMLNHVSDGVFAVDVDKRITFFNRAAEEITGFPASEALGLPCQDVFRSDACGSRCIFDEVKSTGRGVIGRHVTIVDRAGQARVLCVNAALLEDTDGRSAGIIETFRDITAEEELRRRIEQSFTFQDIVSRHPLIQAIFAILPDVARTQVPVLIEGASGTGKELFARAIHNLSMRNEGPFIAVNCGALPDTLLEAELFGYRKGAFTDARTDRDGRFERARGGTLFLDEIGDISAAMQVRLLRVLQEKTFEPLGSTETVSADVRIIAATNRPLADLIEEGKFRQDLFYRLNVMRINLPSLQERSSDIPLLVEHFRKRLNAEFDKNIVNLEPAAWEALLRHDFPGNIRELENILQHAFILCRDNVIGVEHLPPEIRQPLDESEKSKTPRTLREIEMQAIKEALRAEGDNRTAAAARLGIDPSTLYRKLSREENG